MKDVAALTKTELVKLVKSLEKKVFELQGRSLSAKSANSANPESFGVLSHELQVFQEELEMQNQELRLMTEALEESRNRYATLYDYAPVPFFSLDERGVIHEVNLTGARFLNSDRSMLIGKPITMHLKQGYRYTLYQHLKSTFNSASHQTVDLAFQTKVGSVFYVQLDSVAIYDTEHGCKLAWTSMTDITARKMVEKKLLKSEANLQAVFQNTDDIIWSVDKKFRVITFNNAFNNLRKHIAKQSGTITLQDAHSQLSYQWKELYSRAFGGECFTIRQEYVIDGKEYHYEFAFNPIVSEGVVEAVSVFGKDITLRRQMETELLRAKERAEELAKSKSEFFAYISHELRTPLHAIGGFTSLLANYNLPQEVLDYIQSIEGNTEKLIGIINDILDLSKIEWSGMKMQKQPIQPSDVISKQMELLSSLAKSRGLTLNMDDSSHCASKVLVDPKYFEQVMNNLLGNALKFTQQGGVIVSYRERPSVIDIAIKDTGPGISPEFLPKIFDEFKREYDSWEALGAAPGTGLGLAVAKRLIEAMEGSIRVESSPGHGTCFTITLPKE